MDPEDADYKCTLTEYSLAKAKKELNEDPKERLGSVQTLRRWVREQPHYTCRTDTKFLLAIIRKAKFSQLRARELIDNIMVARTTCPEFMANLDTHEPKILKFIEKGLSVYFPKPDKEGRKIFLGRPGLMDLSNPDFSPLNEVRCSIAASEAFREFNDENTSVNGIVVVFDCTGFGPKHFTRSSMDHNKKVTKIHQDCNPERVKIFLIYNAGAIFETMMTFMKPFMKKKMMDRMQVHDTMESMYKVIPMELWPDEYLPDDYKGPSAGPIANLAADTVRFLRQPEVRDRVLANTNDRYKIDESKRPADATPKESFRKLNID